MGCVVIKVLNSDMWRKDRSMNKGHKFSCEKYGQLYLGFCVEKDVLLIYQTMSTMLSLCRSVTIFGGGGPKHWLLHGFA